jgi:hypothetical protein
MSSNHEMNVLAYNAIEHIDCENIGSTLVNSLVAEHGGEIIPEIFASWMAL